MQKYRFHIHSTHVSSNNNEEVNNAVVVKEKILVRDDNNQETWYDHLNIFVDPVRPFWITSVPYRTHRYKKEFEDIDKLEMFTCHDSELTTKVAEALGYRSYGSYKPYKSLRTLCSSPYVYGADIKTEVLSKQKYVDKQPEGVVPLLSKGAFDIENEVNGDKRINLITFIHEHQIYTAALKEYCRIYDEATDTFTPATKEDCLKVINDVIGSEITKHNFTLNFSIHESELELITWIFDRIHECKTDFIGVWNIHHDLPLIIERIEALGGDVAEIMAHPDVPKQYRYASYKEDISKTDHFTDKWHWMSITGYSQFLDSMCLYARLRKVSGREVSYKLDDIANKELGQGKLHFGEITNHWRAQHYEFLPYIAYNINDVLIMMLMEWKNNDIGSLMGLIPVTIPSQFSRQTTALSNDFFYTGKKTGKLPAAVGDQMYTPWDTQYPKVGGTVLPPDKAIGVGIEALEGINRSTQVTVATNDSDVTAMYPSTVQSFNVDKETMLISSLGINGYSHTASEKFFSDVLRPDLNAVDICSVFYGLPNYTNVLNEFDKEF